MSRLRWTRLIIASLTGIALAVALALQAISSTSTRSAPDVAVAAFPANGMAHEALAGAIFTASSQAAVAQLIEEAEQDTGSGSDAAGEGAAPSSQPGQTSASPASSVRLPEEARQEAAQLAADSALKAARADPLVPRAHAILGMRLPASRERSQILELASQLNRRDLTLQSLVLQEHIAAGDYPSTINTLDQILRVHPEYDAEFFPVLVTALAEQETIPLFADMLDGSAPWHAKFLNFAVRERSTLLNLAQLRPQIDAAESDFDRRLIVYLANRGNVEEAASLYRMISDQAPGAGALSGEALGTLDWTAQYPPFEWRFIDQPGFRAQSSRNGDELELFVRPGKGGLIAARMLPVPGRGFDVEVDHDIRPANLREDVGVQLTCSGNAEVVLNERLDSQLSTFAVERLPSNCGYMLLSITARAWTGRSALRGSIRRIRIR